MTYVSLNGNDAWVSYGNVDFGHGPWRNVCVRACSRSGGTLCVSVGDTALAEIVIPASMRQWRTLSVPVTFSPEGICDIRVSVVAGDDVQIDWLRFE